MKTTRNILNVIVLSLAFSSFVACTSAPKKSEVVTTPNDSYFNTDTSESYSDSDAFDAESDDSYSNAEESGDTSAYTSYETSEVDLPESLPTKEEEVSSSAYQSPDESPSASSYNHNNMGATTTYKVKRGDTLMKIAFEFYGDYSKWRNIYNTNRALIGTPETMPTGITLTINDVKDDVQVARNGNAYVIQPEDTLKSISMDLYGTTAKWQSLWHNNPQLIKDPNKIYHGFTMYYTPDHNTRQLSTEHYEESASEQTQESESNYYE